MGHISDLQKKVFKNKETQGFNTTDIQLEFLLTYGELSEAYDAWHKKQADVGEELADVMIYLMGIAEILCIDLDKEITNKMAKNERRKYVRKNGVLVKKEAK